MRDVKQKIVITHRDEVNEGPCEALRLPGNGPSTEKTKPPGVWMPGYRGRHGRSSTDSGYKVVDKLEGIVRSSLLMRQCTDCLIGEHRGKRKMWLAVQGMMLNSRINEVEKENQL